MPNSRVRLAIRLPVTDHQHACITEAVMYDMRDAPHALIERSLADMMVGRHANDDRPEQLWATLFGTERIGFSCERHDDWITITDDERRAKPALVGILVQLVFPARLPLAFTYSSETPGNEFRHSGGCVIVSDLAVIVRDASALAIETSTAAGNYG